jgi:hypothetical protein
MAAKICIAEVEEIVPAGTLDPAEIHLPGIYVRSSLWVLSALIFLVAVLFCSFYFS